MSILTNPTPTSVSSFYSLTGKITFFHDRICFLCCIQGAFFLTDSGRTDRLRKGDLVLLKSPGQSVMRPEGRALFLYLSLDNLFFMDQFGDDFGRLYCNSARYPSKKYDSLRSSLIRLAIAHIQNPDQNQFLISSEIFTLLQVLRADFVDTPADAGGVRLRKNDTALRKRELESYISENYHLPITLQSVADYMHYTPQHLSGFMKKQFGMTFHQYLTRHRLEKATSYLKYRDYSSALISSLCGFSAVSVFEKEFQNQYLTSPDYYRTNYLNTHPAPFSELPAYSDTAFIRAFLESGFTTLPPMAPVIENISRQHHTFDVSSSVEVSLPWMEMINLGSGENFDNPLFRQHVELLQNTLHFRYARIINILDLAQHYETGIGTVWKLDRVFHSIDYIRSLGMIPFLDLSNKEINIYQEESPAFREDPDSYDRRMASLLPEFLRQCAQRYEPEELAQWKFELWLRYHDSRMHKLEDPQTYLKRFRAVRSMIREYLPDTPLGGCGFNTYLPDQVLEDILTGFSQAGEQPDFLSVYLFPYRKQTKIPDAIPAIPPLEESPTYFEQRLAAIRQMMQKFGIGSLPLYVTEFGTHIGFQNHLNDSMYQAAFLTRQLIHARTLADGFAYWIASDFSIEFHNNNLFLFGGNGLISQQGGRKPGFFAYQFLSRLGTRLIGQGVHYIITSTNEDSYQILLYNYTHFSRSFCQNPERYELTDFAYAIFETKTPYEFSLTLKNMPQGTYKQTRFLADQDHGCLFTRWSRMQFASDLSAEELEMLNGECIPRMEISHLLVDGSIVLDQTIGRNELCLICLQRMI